MAQQYPTKRPDGVVPYKIVLVETAMRNDGTCFTDHDVHTMLQQKRVMNVGGEWFRCSPEEVKAAIVAIKTGTLNDGEPHPDFSLRPEQKEALDKTIEYYRLRQEEISLTARRSSSGMPRCALARPSPPISWPNAWA